MEEARKEGIMNYSIFNSQMPSVIFETLPLNTAVDDETMQVLINHQKPLKNDDDYFQYLTAVSVIPDINNRHRSTYLTFAKDHKKQWRFIGLCFSMSYINQYDKEGKRI